MHHEFLGGFLQGRTDPVLVRLLKKKSETDLEEKTRHLDLGSNRVSFKPVLSIRSN